MLALTSKGLYLYVRLISVKLLSYLLSSFNIQYSYLMFDFLFHKPTSPPPPLPKKPKKQQLTSTHNVVPANIVDIGYMFGIMIKVDTVTDSYFSTSKTYADIIENQEIQFAKMQIEDEFWSYICNRSRKPTLPIHHKIEEFIRIDLFELTRQEETVYQIGLDVPRTFPNIEDPTFTEKLSRVLIAYSLRNPKLGYPFTGTLLLFMEEEAAFWMLVYIVEELLTNYFVPTMSGYHIDADVFDKIVSDNLPELYEHFRKINLSCKVLTSTWFLSLFVNDFPVVTAFVVWDTIMLNGATAMFEIALTVLYILQDEILLVSGQVEVMQILRSRTTMMFDPRSLMTNRIKLDKSNVMSIRRKVGQKVEEEALYNRLNQQFQDLEIKTHYEPHELVHLWRQYTQLDPFLAQSTTAGLDLELFSQLIGGTFSEWYADRELVGRLFVMADTNHDGLVSFSELVSLFSVMTRGNFSEIVKFNFDLFDIKSKGWIDSFDLLRMLQSVYGMFKDDRSFYKRLHLVVNEIFNRFAGAIRFENFKHIVAVQSQIMEKMKARNPNTLYTYTKTYYYWLFDFERTQRKTEMIRFAIDKHAIRKQSSVPSPTLYL